MARVQTADASDETLDYIYRVQLQAAGRDTKMCSETPAPNSNPMGSEGIPIGSVNDEPLYTEDLHLVPANPLVWAYETLSDPKTFRRPRMKNLLRVVDARKHRTRVRKMKSTRPGPDEAIDFTCEKQGFLTTQT